MIDRVDTEGESDKEEVSWCLFWSGFKDVTAALWI